MKLASGSVRNGIEIDETKGEVGMQLAWTLRITYANVRST